MKKIFLWVPMFIYTFGLPMLVSASISQGTNITDRIEIGTADSITNIESEFTVLVWVKPDAVISTNRAIFVGRANGLSGSSNASIRTLSAAPATDVSFRVLRSGTGLRYDSSDAPLLPGNWTFLAFTHDEASASTHIYHGSLSQVAIESTYAAGATEGTGTVNLDSGTDSAAWGNRLAGTWSGAFTGTFGVGAVVTRPMTLAEIRAWQYAPRNIPGTVNLMFFGLTNGTGAQTDYSGYKNTGTVIGGVYNHVNLPFKWFKR